MWLSPPPACCEICGLVIKDEFVDGKTTYGPWACMCMMCHRDQRFGFGLGKGQHFKFDGKHWLKVKG